jgi:hypothetical protein
MVLLNLPFFSWIDNWVNSALATRSANLAVDQCFQMVSLVSLLNCTWSWPGWPWIVGSMLIALLAAIIYFNRINLLSEDSQALQLHASRQTFDRRLALYLTISLLLIDHTRIADQMLLLVPLLIGWRDWPLLRTKTRQNIAIFLSMSIYVLPYTLDFFGGRNLAYLLPFWYIGLSGAVLGILLLELVGEFQEARLALRQSHP